ncbi:hypothetical protein BD414DRAFT_158608 [Trametes punicea]|nr:hypothetical protein BD414DRAFT_158608 [Trametes punicea]
MSHAHKPSLDNEMHELNAEADLLDQKTTVVPAGVNGEDTKLQSHHTDPDAQAMVIESLRAQVQDLFSQVSQLNNKLVRSYDRVSDLEDELHVTSSNLRQATLKISQLELERTQHLSALSTGLLVEKSHVTAELNRLMEKATEEAARRGQAETARAEIEKELDDLSAGLFNQANTMVAEARMAEARSARKLEETEAALRGAEEVVGALQAQMQALQAEKEKADRRVEEMRARMGKGKWVERSPEASRPHRPRLMASHVPYHEFLIFISHLRAIRPASAQPPAMSTLLPLPFLARLVAEDSDPTVRLDLAPSLNWLSRRSVLAAIHSGQLTVEPMHFSTLLEELAPTNIPSNSHHTHIVCALCGMPIYSSSDSPNSTPTTPNPSRSGSQTALWSASLFKNVRSGELSLSAPFTSHNRHSAHFGPASSDPPSQVYIFRLEATSSGLPVSLPLSSQQPGTPTRQSTIYPLCTTGWCLARLRTTCSLWAFVRTSIVEKIWDEPPFTDRPSSAAKAGINGVSADKKHDTPNGVAAIAAPEAKPALPPRRSKIGLSSLWGSMQRSLSGAREPDTVKSKEGEKKEETRPKLPPRDPSRKMLPPAPPVHPALAAQPSAKPAGAVHSVPPPLPKRNRERDARGASRSVTPDPGYASAAQHVPDSEPEPPREDVHAAPNGIEDEKPKEEAPAEPQEGHAQEEHTLQSQESSSSQSKDESALTQAKPALLAPSPALSRNESHDSFTTPTEELAPPFSVSPSPAPTAVPLPPSQAPTPEPQEPQAEDTNPSPEPATFVLKDDTGASAPPAPAVRMAVQEEKPPSRTASPAPPPLPRRAAARARPTSILLPHVEAQPQKQNTDGTATAVAASDAPASVPSEGDPTQSASVTEEPERTAASSTEDLTTRVDGSAEGEADAGEEEEESRAGSAGAEEDKHEAEADGDVPTATATPQPELAVEAEPEAESGGALEKDDQGRYVGDATWEERTYKELVRLREEMFWARIGAVAGPTAAS